MSFFQWFFSFYFLRASASFKISDLNGLPVILKIFLWSTPILSSLRSHRRGQAWIVKFQVSHLSSGQMCICLENKCVFVLRTNVYSHCFSQIPLFVGVLPRFGEWPWQMGSSQPLSLQYVLSPKQRKLRHIKAGCFGEISELANYMMVGTVGTGQSLLVLESSFLSPNPVYK